MRISALVPSFLERSSFVKPGTETPMPIQQNKVLVAHLQSKLPPNEVKNKPLLDVRV